MNNDERDNAIILIREIVQGMKENQAVVMTTLADIKEILFNPISGLCKRVQQLEDAQHYCQERQREREKMMQSNQTAWYAKTNNLIALGALVVAIVALWKG